MRKILYIISFLLIVHCTLNAEDCMSQWIQQGVPTNQVIQDMHFLDSLNGWLACSNGAASDSGLILRTTDGGDSWIKQYGADSTPLLAIKMADVNTGYCVGGFRKILKTTDGGDNWINVNTGFANYLSDVSVPNQNGDTVYVIDRTSGEGIWKSTNGGLNFTNIYPPAFGTTLFFLNNLTGWANVGHFFLVKTTNGGQNWVTQQTFPGTIGDIFFVNETTGWLIGGDSTGVLKSTNGGINFIAQNPPPESWGEFSIFMNNENNGWIGSAFNKILKTYDGTIWELQDIPIFSSFEINFIDTLVGWTGASSLAKTTNGGVTYIGQVNSEIPENYSLSQNYPNPFNPQTTIEFSIVKSSIAELQIFDILGKEVFNTKSSGILSPGTHKFVFNGIDLPSGIYFYKLIVKNSNSLIRFTDTKKMVLVK